jgi:hypothetical protein
MIQRLRLERQDPTGPDDFALQLEFRGAETADFIVGGTLPGSGGKVIECRAGNHLAEPIHEDGKWHAVFKGVAPGDYLLTVKAVPATNAGLDMVTDQVRIRITTTKKGAEAPVV